jgi:hypothetical protein
VRDGGFQEQRTLLLEQLWILQGLKSMAGIPLEPFFAILTSAALVWAAVRDVQNRLIPRMAGFGVLAIGLGYLILNSLWLESAFFLAAIWGSRGGVWRLPVLVLAVLLLANDPGLLPYVLGMLYVQAIFDLGWFGGGDAQIAFGLIALGKDWWILVYLFGSTILLGLTLVFQERGFGGGLGRLRWVLKHMNAPDKEAIKIPWAVLASTGGLAYIWVFPGLM